MYDEKNNRLFRSMRKPREAPSQSIRGESMKKTATNAMGYNKLPGPDTLMQTGMNHPIPKTALNIKPDK